MKAHSTRNRIGIFGGSFDPVHFGHLIIAQDAVEKLSLLEVVFIPASIPPHKQHIQKIDGHHRFNMLKLAIGSDRRFSVSDQEIQRGGVSYTYDTLLEIKAARPDAELVMIVGSDTLVDLHNWYRIDELLDLCEVSSFMRPGESVYEEIREKVKLSDRHKKKILDNVFETHLIDIASTEIRTRVAEGRGIQYLVPPEVETYIFEHGLYQG